MERHFGAGPFRAHELRLIPKARVTQAAIAPKPDVEWCKGMSGDCRPSLHDHARRRTFSINAVGSGAWRENAIVKLARP